MWSYRPEVTPGSGPTARAVSQDPACSSTGSSPDMKARVQSLAQTPPNLILGDILLFSLATK